jgi:ribosomal protein S18 acetylase RimI-like enzyme
MTFPWQIYRNDRNWVPPLLTERKSFLNPRKHPFYQHGAAVPMLAWRDGTIVGRILVSEDPNFNDQWDLRCGCFGMFETIDDPDVAGTLIDAAAHWLRDRNLTTMRGPIDYSMNYACGLLVDGFDTPPRIMMNHNPPYYPALLEAAGLAKVKDLYAWWFVDSENMLDKWRDRAERLSRRNNITVRPFVLKDLAREIERCKEVYNHAWEQHWGFVKMTDAEFDYLAVELQRFADPNLLWLAENDGQPVGFSMTLPDVNEALARINGRLTRWGIPIGLAKLMYGIRHIQTARMLVLGVLNEFRRRGVLELLILRTLDYGRNQLHYSGAELSWTLEDNYLINRAIERVGGKRYKTYRIYEASLDTRPGA